MLFAPRDLHAGRRDQGHVSCAHPGDDQSAQQDGPEPILPIWDPAEKHSYHSYQQRKGKMGA